MRAWIALIACILCTADAYAQLSTNARTGRFIRGTSGNEDLQSFVLALDFQKGVLLDNVGGNGSNWFGGNPLTNTRYHYNATNPASASGTNGRIAYQTPIVAFGSRMGGTPLYAGTQYRFGIATGFNLWGTEDPMVYINVYDKRSNYTKAGEINFYLPRTDETNEWTQFATNGYTISSNQWGLRTVISDHPGSRWSLNDAVTDSYVLTHEAFDSSASNYLFEVRGYGFWTLDGTNVYAMSLTADGFDTETRLYSLEFDTRPASRLVFIDQPHFRGEPLPPEYAGKTVEELTNFTASVTNEIWITNSANFFTLDQSPELRQHPILDKFVADMRYDPLALTEFVLNEIELTDAMAEGETGQALPQSINLGGINRSALGTFLERQGSPWEQCALLVYLLRAAGQPAAYVFPTNNNLKMLDIRLSKLLRMQLKGAVDNEGDVYTTNTLLSVNYPWVVANINSNRVVHIFPWLKDTEVVEGLNVYDYMPTNYDSGYKWARQYLYGDTNILNLSTETDVPRILFPKFIERALLTNQPGVSIDDLGVRAFNRRHSYARWEDLPRPTVLSNPTQVAVISNLVTVTNALAWMTAPFDTLRVQVLRNTTTLFDTGDLCTADLNARKFLLFTNAGKLNLWLASYRPSITNQSSFTNDSALLNKQLLQVNVLTGDTNLTVRLIHLRHRFLSNDVPSFDLFEWRSLTNELGYSKVDVSAICLNFGRVTLQMLEPHMEDYWNVERRKQTNSSYVPAREDFQGTAAYLIGMGYHEKRSRFEELNQGLHKVRQLSLYTAGLGRLATKVVTNVNKAQPGVDMIAQPLIIVANGSLRPDSQIDDQTAFESYSYLNLISSSAEEHAIINSVFGETNSISTARLLHLAQRRSNTNRAGIVELHRYDYVTRGNQASTGYGSTLLKNYDSGIWAAITNAFSESDSVYSTVFISPASITNDNKSYNGMAAFILTSGSRSALISGNKNGGEGSYYSPFDVSPTVSYLPYSLYASQDGSFGFNFINPSFTQVLAPLSPTDVARVTQGIYNLFASPYQWDSSRDISISLNLTDSNFRSTTFAAEDNGHFGRPGFLQTMRQMVNDPVNALTGEFYIDATDLTLPGPMPLKVRRNYLSQNRSENQFGIGWKMNYVPYLIVTTNASNVPLIYAAEPEGSVVLYRGTNDVWRPTPGDNPTLNNHSTAGIGSVANMFNARIERVVTNSIETYFLHGPDGSVRRFEVSSEFAILSGTNNLDRTRPYLREWKDNRGNFYRFGYGTNAIAPDFGQLVRIESSNGSFLGFRYDVYARIIEAYTGDGRRLLYEYDQFGDLVRVTLPDASEIVYEYQHYTFTTTNGSTVYTNLDSNHLLTREIKPDGRVLENFYDSQRRVTVQKATVGADLNTYTNGVFTYANNFNLTNAHTNSLTGHTLIADAYNRVMRYDYTNGLITSITNPLGHATLQDWFEAGETNKPGYYQRSLEKMTDTRGLQTFYKYDTNGNLTNTIVQGDLTGNGNSSEQAATSTSYTANHLIAESVNPAGTTNRYFYTNTWLLSRIEIHPTNSTSSSIVSNVFVYGSATNAVTNGARIFTNIALGLRQQEIRAFGSPDAATNEWVYDGRGFPTAEIRYTGTSDPNITNYFVYNGRGELEETIDGAGRRTRTDHDALGRPILREVYEANQVVPLATDYSYYNENGELVWSDGPRFGPEDYVYRDYDGAGRKVHEIRWRSQAKIDGTGVEAETGDDLYATAFSEYDLFGNLIRTIDARGNFTTNIYDGIGQRIQQRFFDATTGTWRATNGFGYEPGGLEALATNALGGVTEKQYTTAGQPKYQKNPDGSTNGWRYYLDGRPHKEFIANGNFWETTYDDSVRKATKVFKTSSGSPLATNIVEHDRRGNAIRTVDAAGFASTNYFDGLDRPKGSAGPVIVYEPPPGAPQPPGGNPPNIQQTSTTSYGIAGQVVTNVNGLGEKTITYSDALGRPTRTEVRSAFNVIVRETSYSYAADHHSVTVTNGSGATAIAATTFTDNDGKTVLSIAYPAADVRHFTRREYDVTGNLTTETVNSKTNSTVSVWQTKTFTYDGLNRVATKIEKDGAQTTFHYDAFGNITNRAMPSGLNWRAEYDSAGRVTKDYDIAGSTGAKTNIYVYFGAGSPFTGLLLSKTDGRNVVCTYGYDAYLRTTTNAHTGPSAEHNQTTIWSFDVRGYVTNVSETFASSATGPSTKIVRSFNPYGQAKTESVYIGTFAEYGNMQSWDAAGRRKALGFGGHGTTFGWRADGLLLSATDPSGGGIYTYDTAGQLSTRTVGARVTTLAQRDGAGRILTISNTIAGTSRLTETLTWTGDGLPATDTMTRSDFTDSRAYFYASQSRRLTEERLNIDATKRWTNSFTYDNGSPSGAGVLTKAGIWSGATNPLLQVISETNLARRVPAWGTNNGLASVSAYLDGQPVPITQIGTQKLEWRATMEVLPGAHQLKVAALHPSGLYTASATNSFTNSGPSEIISETHDGSGRITARVWKTGSTTNLTETWSWDAKGRLWKIVQRDATQSGFDETHVYDPLGRRLQTTRLPYISGVAISNSTVTTRQVYDPQHEFLELGASRNSVMMWKLYGPDLNGVYGSLNGLGGFEAIIPAAELFCPVISDSLGNLHGLYDQNHATFEWFSTRVTAFGSVPGYEPLPYAQGAPSIAHASAWRGKWLDDLDRAQWGVRPYLMDSARFASPEPLWPNGNENPYTGWNGQLNFDADARLASGTAHGAGHLVQGLAGLAHNAVGALSYQVTAPFAPGWAAQQFGQQANNFNQTLSGLNQLSHDIVGSGLYAATAPFSSTFAENNYGLAVNRLGDVGMQLTGGENRSTAYRIGYSIFNAAAVALGGELGQMSRAGRFSSAAESTAQQGTQLYRVFGNEARGLGNYYTTINPATVADFRTTAGLFPGNSGSFVLEGTLNNTEGVIFRSAAPGPGGVGGGLSEVFVPNPATQINIQRVSGVNPPF